MASLLLVILTMMFMSIGIPDSLFGTAWPAIYREFGVSISSASLITVLISGCTVISCCFSARLIHKFGTAVVIAVSTALSACALFGFSVSGGFWMLCLFAVPLGLSAGAIDSGMNSFVAIHYKASYINFMLCFYGLAVSLSPYLMRLALMGNTWRQGYRMAFFLQAALAVIAILSIPLWKRVHPKGQTESAGTEMKLLSLKEMLRMAPARWVFLYFFISSAAEVTGGTWCSTFLVESRAFLPENAAVGALCYYLGMTAGRFVSGFATRRYSCWALIQCGVVLWAAAYLFLLLPLPGVFLFAGLFLAGMGMGPIFPNMMHLTAESFAPEIALSISGLQMTATYLGILLMPAVFGFFAQWLGTGTFPAYLLLLVILTGISVAGLRKSLGK